MFRMNARERNEAGRAYVKRERENVVAAVLVQYFSPRRSSANDRERENEEEEEEKQQEAIRADGQVIHLSRKLSSLSLPRAMSLTSCDR